MQTTKGIQEQAKNALINAPGIIPLDQYLAKQEVQQKILSVLPMVGKEEREIMKQTLLRLMVEANNHNEKLAACTTESKINALLDCARTGLVPFTAMNEAYIIPYGRIAKFQFGYRGVTRLCRNTGIFRDIYAKTVREDDEFGVEIYRSEQVVNYKPSFNPIFKKVRTKRGNKYYWNIEELRPIKLFFAVFTLVNGGMNFEVMSRQDMEIHRDKYVKSNIRDPEAVWNREFPEMGNKTILGKVLKYAPKSEKLIKALRLDETLRDVVPLPEDFTPEAQKAFEERRSADVEGGEKGGTTITVETKKTEEKKKATGDTQKAKGDKTPQPKETADKTKKAGGNRLSKIWQEGFKRGEKVNELRNDMKKKYKLKSITDLTVGQYDEIMASLKKMPEKKEEAKFNKEG